MFRQAKINEIMGHLFLFCGWHDNSVLISDFSRPKLLLPPSSNRPMTNSLVIMMIVAVVKMVASSPMDYAGSFEHVSSGNVVNKVTPKHFEVADKITAASDTLRSQTSSQAVQFKTAKNQFIDVSKDALAASHTAVHGVSVGDEANDVNTLRPVRTTPKGSVEKATKTATTANEHYANAVAATYHESLLEVVATSQSSAAAGVTGAAASCEVCVYVVENKQMHQPFLCRGLKDPAYQQSVSTCCGMSVSLLPLFLFVCMYLLPLLPFLSLCSCTHFFLLRPPFLILRSSVSRR